MNKSAVRAIAGRDLRLVGRNRAVLIPVVIVPVVLLLVPPLALLATADAPARLAAELQRPITRLSPTLPGLPSEPGQQAILLVLVYVFAPLFLLVPIIVASVTAADSIVGERERQTLEVLLHSPTTDRELFVGKLLAPWTLAMLVASGSAVTYGAVANIVLGQFGLPPSFPNLVWAVLLLWVAPPAAGLGIGVIVAISGRVTTFHEASQISGIVVLPIVGLVVAQIAGALLFDVALLGGLGFALWLLTLVTLRVGARRFRRDRLLSGD